MTRSTAEIATMRKANGKKEEAERETGYFTAGRNLEEGLQRGPRARGRKENWTATLAHARANPGYTVVSLCHWCYGSISFLFFFFFLSGKVCFLLSFCLHRDELNSLRSWVISLSVQTSLTPLFHLVSLSVCSIFFRPFLLPALYHSSLSWG